MEKTHFGDAEKGILCRGGLVTGKSMALDWRAVTCKSCQEKQLPASVMRADDVAAWLAERIPGNVKMRARQAEHQVEWTERKDRWGVTETMALHAIQHDVMVECPGDWATITPLPEKKAPYGVTQQLKVQARSSITSIVVTVTSAYHAEDEVVCKVVWEDTLVTDVWRDHQGITHENAHPLVEDRMPYEQVAGYWKQGPVAALERYHAELLAQREEMEDDD